MPLKSAYMKPNLPENFRSRYAQPKGFKENRSCISQDAPSWFKVHDSVVTRVTPHDPDNKTNISLYLKTTKDVINSDGSRKKHLYRTGPRGVEDTAVSAKAPAWMQIQHVPSVDTPVTSFYDPYDKSLHESTFGTTASSDLPEWAQITSVPKKPPRIQKAEVRWRHDWQRPEDSIRFDRDSATSKQAPDFFHIEGVPRAELNNYGGYDFDYDHGSFGLRKKNFRQVAARQPNLRHKKKDRSSHLPSPHWPNSGRDSNLNTQQIQHRTGLIRASTSSRTSRPLNSSRVITRMTTSRKDAEVFKLREAIKEQKKQNLRLLSQHIEFHEKKMKQSSRLGRNYSRGNNGNNRTALW